MNTPCTFRLPEHAIFGAEPMVRKNSKSTKLPAGAGILARRFPEIWEAYAALGERCAEAGPLEPRIRHLVKIALAAGAGSEGVPLVA
jgi:alkylhydroperoxidase/carboxymuconolactone decarboxylase family protein YurZ